MNEKNSYICQNKYDSYYAKQWIDTSDEMIEYNLHFYGIERSEKFEPQFLFSHWRRKNPQINILKRFFLYYITQ